MRIERIGLEHHGKPRLAGASSVTSLPSISICRRRVLKAGDQPQQRGLAAARRADEDDELAVLDRQVDPRNDLGVAEDLVDLFEGECCPCFSSLFSVRYFTRRRSGRGRVVSG
jgi:hypothetical protein